MTNPEDYPIAPWFTEALLQIKAATDALLDAQNDVRAARKGLEESIKPNHRMALIVDDCAERQATLAGAVKIALARGFILQKYLESLQRGVEIEIADGRLK